MSARAKDQVELPNLLVLTAQMGVGIFGVAKARLKARIAGLFYLLTFLTGGVALFVRGRAASATSHEGKLMLV